ncbi:hypothetical protein A3A46_01020 [Candidatus Roizmanbacteria bacterium RIFCSPLOWO2_01_FULL_37_13]|uniref:DUF1189 domain-containing protein n=1 Tax=Candidatus Roizmanbacteria bacterium RIFCSPHIGHO2_02_FULL_38_11 TaxID=1802039 RepID=A0A1F7GXT0_9BACT|nr:MAG: hypothetical protein A3C25_05480 [Candidatus Roizmanbacteria bacterium RIFCSPHIGHO2_02_FULL_38_11]OGK35507.1 MAG: hypothetical protein A3F58_01005 [Candidatus Roizmanbacteria bacterium RIFCSPHIGHO2_12_FULL_37_9b]OGK41269.1 MAG: hypothetical protein A3A46_01020 [Candidatus Roizmanbacteria bacterium RIFCSPLOWO2_01_FULL_37_13]
MNYLKVFFYVWKKSFSSAEYYKEVIKAPFSFSLKYFLFFCFLLSIVTTVYLSAKIFSPLNNFLIRFPQVLVKVYPEQLEIKIQKGVVTTNVPEPYFIPIDRFEKTFEEFDKEVKGIKSDEIENVLVIDTNARVEDLKRYQTYALLTRNYLVYYKDKARIEIVPLDEIKNFTLNQGLVKGVINRFLPLLRVIAIFLIPFIFVGSFLFFSIFQLIYLLFSALVLFLGGKLISYPVNYLKSYQIDLHLATIITPFFLVLRALNFEVQFPFLRLILFSLIGLYIFNSLKNSAPRVKKTKK